MAAKTHDSGYRTTDDGKLVGPKMHRAVRAVAKHGPYSAKLPLAESVGPHSSRRYGYEIVDRCIPTLLELDPDHEAATASGRGAVVLTDEGRRYLEETDPDALA